MAEMQLDQPSFIAYTDESHYNKGTIRGLAMVTMDQRDSDSLNGELRKILEDCGISEFKWKECKTAKMRFAALKLLEWAIYHALAGSIRIDILTWDISDTRHNVFGRDDIANLQRMYFHLFRNVINKRWPAKSNWKLCPDEQMAVHWNEIRYQLRSEPNAIEEIVPHSSHQHPFIQLADLFAGLAVFSRDSYSHYEEWQLAHDQSTGSLVSEGTNQFSNSLRERCFVLAQFDQQCKENKLSISLKSRKGLRTGAPNKPINFWWYEPQSPKDKAPKRKKPKHQRENESLISAGISLSEAPVQIKSSQ